MWLIDAIMNAIGLAIHLIQPHNGIYTQVPSKCYELGNSNFSPSCVQKRVIARSIASF